MSICIHEHERAIPSRFGRIDSIGPVHYLLLRIREAPPATLATGMDAARGRAALREHLDRLAAEAAVPPHIPNGVRFTFRRRS